MSISFDFFIISLQKHKSKRQKTKHHKSKGKSRTKDGSRGRPISPLPDSSRDNSRDNSNDKRQRADRWGEKESVQCLISGVKNKPLIKAKAPMGAETIPELKNRGWANIQCKHV